MSVRNAYQALAHVRDVELRQRVPLAQLTTLRVGGPAELLVVAHSYTALVTVLRTLAEERVRWVVLGKGSNILAADAGYAGCIIQLGREFSRIQVEGNTICAGGAVFLSKLVNESLSQGLSGLECCVGIPGTVGGAVSMNAGTRDEWIGASISDVITLSPRVGMRRHLGSQIEWDYRWTSLPADEIILEATFSLTESDKDKVAASMNQRLARRRRTQPAARATCGSVFKNPAGGHAGALLEACGLKGYELGGAQVSTEHANFVVNRGNARAADIIELISHMHSAVQEQEGIDLLPEVKTLGFAW